MAGILVEHYFVEGVSDDACLLTNIVIASVASPADDDAASLCWQIGDSLHQGFDGIWVVSVVGYDGGAFVVEHIEPPWNALAVTDEAGESFADGFPRDMDGPSRCDGCHSVFDLEGDSAASGDWHFRQRDANRVRALHRDDVVIFHK